MSIPKSALTFALLAMMLLAPAPALAHASLQASRPVEGATVTAPRELLLRFSEGVQLRFSTFKVYPLPRGESPAADRRAAAALRERVIGLHDDGARRADLGTESFRGNPKEVRIALRERLPAGAYALMWRVLSEDGHTVQGQLVFYVR